MGYAFIDSHAAVTESDKSKLSKRKNPTAIGFYKDMGFLPEALLNYLGMLGWSMPGGEEKFSLEDMVTVLTWSNNSRAPIFDMKAQMAKRIVA